MIKRVLGFGGLLVLVLLVAYAGISVYVNIAGRPAAIRPPSVKDAPYSFRVVVTGNVVLAKQYTHDGTIYTLDGYYEIVNGRYVYRKATLKLDERTFGTIEMKRRVSQ